ncbi:hypothetical protein HDR58_05605 [bacterium]|nr:hypothetical protein [bacterium]
MSEEKKKMSLGKKILIGIGIYLVVGVIAAGIMAQTDSVKNAEKSTTSETAKVSAPKIAWKRAGMYKVGAEIPAGEYLIQPQGDAAYYEVATDSSGSMNSIITNDLLAGCSVYVSVRAGQYLTVRSAKFTNAENYEASPASPIKQGMYRVGRDISAGEYKVTSNGGNTYCAVQKDSYNTLGSILTNDALFEGSKYVTVRDGQYLLIKDCTAVRVE